MKDSVNGGNPFIGNWNFVSHGCRMSCQASPARACERLATLVCRDT